MILPARLQELWSYQNRAVYLSSHQVIYTIRGRQAASTAWLCLWSGLHEHFAQDRIVLKICFLKSAMGLKWHQKFGLGTHSPNVRVSSNISLTKCFFILLNCISKGYYPAARSQKIDVCAKVSGEMNDLLLLLIIIINTIIFC